jgi:SMODS and SLOG-associating 2TM effector domain 1
VSRRLAQASSRLPGSVAEGEPWLLLESFAAPPPDAPGIPFRVRVGVTGHRTLQEPGSVRRRVEHVLDWIETTVLTASPLTPVVYTVFSALAEGADRLVAKVVLERDSAELRVVLPMKAGEFMRDFRTEESRDEFAAMLRSAAEPPFEPLQEEQRPEAYASGGRALVDRVDILIAVWDHEPPRGVGGTATVVRYAHGKDVPIVVVSAVDPGRIDFPPPPERRSRAYRVLDPLDLYPGERREDTRIDVLRNEYRRLDAFNREELQAYRLERECERERAGPAPAARQVGIDESFADWSLPFFVRADLLARLYQWKYTRLALVVFVAAASAVSIAALVEIRSANDHWLWGEVGLMILVFALVLYARGRRPHDRWISYRSLAENLRSTPFLALTSGRENEPEQRDDPFEPWFQRAFTEVWKRRPLGQPVPDDAGLLARFFDDAWIGGQIAYHGKASKQFNRRHRRITSLIYATFLVTLLSVLLDMFVHGFGSKWFVLLAISLPAFGAALSGYRELRQYSLHAERYRRARNRLEDIRIGMRAEGTPEEVKARAAGAYVVMLEENLDWFGVLEFTDLEIVI